MRLPQNPGFAISGGAHVLLFAAILLSFSYASQFEDAQESIPVEMLTDQEFNQIMQGEKTAVARPKPARRAEKIAELVEPKPHPATQEAKADVPAPPPKLKREPDPGLEPSPPPASAERAAPAPPPRPAPQPPVTPPESESAEAIEQKPAAKSPVEAKVDPKPVQKPAEKPKPKFKPDQVAKLLDHENRKDLTKQIEKAIAKPKSEPKSEPEEPPQKFDAGDISRFLTKEAPQRKASTGRELQQEASLGSPTASAAKMSPSLWGQLDGLLQEQYKRCWNFVGLGGQKKYVPEIHVQYAQNGSLIGQPSLLNPPSDPNLRTLADSALRAVRRCDPLHIPAQYQPYYDQWKGRIVRFDPEDML
jgi:colicin import membrane protein